jgi:hypothetical protein
MSETKKYRLEIPEEVPADKALMTYILRARGIKEIEPGFRLKFECDGLNRTVVFENIPDSWLKELPAEPISAGESWELQKGRIAGGTNGKGFYIMGFEDGEQNNELRHRGTKTKDDAWLEFCDKNEWGSGDIRIFSAGWKARGRSHNLD